MTQFDDGNSAFPWTDSGLRAPGMTLRDYFAAKAIQAQLTAFWALETHHGWSHGEIAREAYAVADAMLAARGPQ